MVAHVRPVRVTIEGVKAYDGDYTIERLAAFVGPVGSGKSRVQDAIRFAALGYVPALGGREVDTARIMRGARMHVRVELSDARHFARSLIRDGATLRVESRASWIPATATNTAHGAAIRGLFGESDAEAAECLDLRELLDASPSARASRIEAILAATAMRPDEAKSLLRSLTVSRLAGIDEARLPGTIAERVAFWTGLLPTLDKATVLALGSTMERAEAELAGGVPKLLLFANDGKKAATEAVRRKTSARAEVEDRSRGLEAPAATLADLNARRDAASARVATLRAGIEAARKIAWQRNAAEETLTRARLDVVDHPQVREGIAQARADAARWTAEAEAIVDPAAPASPKLVETDPKVIARADDLDADAAKIDAQAAKIEAVPEPAAAAYTAPADLSGLEGEAARASAELDRARVNPWTKVRTLADEVEHFLDGDGSGSVDPERVARELRTLADANGQDVAAAFSRWEAASARVSEGLAAGKRVRESNEEAIAARDKAVTKWKHERAKAFDLRGSAKAKRTEASKIRTDELARVAAENDGTVTAHEVQVDAVAKVVRVNAERRKTLRAQAASATEDADGDEKAIEAEAAAVREAEAKLSGLAEAAPFDLAGAEAERVALLSEVDTIDATKVAVEGADARKRELDTLSAELVTAQAEAKVYVALEWSAQRLRERDLAARGGPILDRMRVFLRAAGRTEDPYLRASKGATDFGWRRAGAELPIEALSGGETVLFSTALAAAIIGLRAPVVRVLLVEAAELGQDAPALAILAGVAALGSEIDGAIVATCAPIAPPAPWQTFRLVGGSAK